MNSDFKIQSNLMMMMMMIIIIIIIKVIIKKLPNILSLCDKKPINYL